MDNFIEDRIKEIINKTANNAKYKEKIEVQLHTNLTVEQSRKLKQSYKKLQERDWNEVEKYNFFVDLKNEVNHGKRVEMLKNRNKK